MVSDVELITIIFNQGLFQKPHSKMYMNDGTSATYYIAHHYPKIFIENLEKFEESEIKKYSIHSRHNKQNNYNQLYNGYNYDYGYIKQQQITKTIESSFINDEKLVEAYYKKINELGYNIINVNINDIIKDWLNGRKASSETTAIAAKKADKSPSKSNCPICLEDHGRIVLSCGHSFCIECLVEIANKKCQTCDKIVTSACLLY